MAWSYHPNIFECLTPPPNHPRSLKPFWFQSISIFNAEDGNLSGVTRCLRGEFCLVSVLEKDCEHRNWISDWNISGMFRSSKYFGTCNYSKIRFPVPNNCVHNFCMLLHKDGPESMRNYATADMHAYNNIGDVSCRKYYLKHVFTGGWIRDIERKYSN